MASPSSFGKLYVYYSLNQVLTAIRSRKSFDGETAVPKTREFRSYSDVLSQGIVHPSKEEPAPQELSTLDSESGQINPVSVILSSRLLRSEGIRAASANHQAVLNSVITQMQAQNSYGYYSQPMKMEVMSEDGTKANWGTEYKKNEPPIAFAVETRPLSIIRVPESRRSVASYSSQGSRSIASLPTKYIYAHSPSPQQLKFNNSTLLPQQPWSHEETLHRHRSLSMCYKSDIQVYRSNPDLVRMQSTAVNLFPPMVSRAKHNQDAISDNMNISDDEDPLLVSLLSHEINDFILKLDAADAALRK